MSSFLPDGNVLKPNRVNGDGRGGCQSNRSENSKGLLKGGVSKRRGRNRTLRRMR